MRFDLHTHTTASDGTDTPSQLIRRAARSGFELIAVTDHDTLSGLPEAEEAGRQNGVRVIGGVEISAGIGREVHVLGYGVREREKLEKTLRDMRENRVERLQKMIDKLYSLGIEVQAERVRALAGASVGRAHLARVLVEMGVVRDVQEAFVRYLGEGRPAYVPREKLSVKAAIRLLRDCGALPVIAHPGQNKGDDFWLPERVTEMAGEGLGGLEVYHMAHTQAQCLAYERLARRNHLLVTGGSDYHGAVKRVSLGDGMQYWHSREEDLRAFLQCL